MAGNDNDITKHLKDHEGQYGKEQLRQPFQPYIEKRSRLPINLFLKIALLLVVLTYLLDRYAEYVLPLLPANQQKQVRNFIEKQNNRASKSPAAGNKKASQEHPPAGQYATTFIDGQTAIPEGANPNDFVQINRRYYKRRSDKVYIVNGQRLFFDDNLADERKKNN